MKNGPLRLFRLKIEPIEGPVAADTADQNLRHNKQGAGSRLGLAQGKLS